MMHLLKFNVNKSIVIKLKSFTTIHACIKYTFEVKIYITELWENGRHFEDDVFKYFLGEGGPINNIPALV